MKHVFLWLLSVNLLSVSLSTAAAAPSAPPPLAWEARFSGPGNSIERANAMAVDDSGNIYLAGQSAAANGLPDYVVLKYAPQGELVWERIYNSPRNGFDIASDVAVDSAGNVYVTGTSSGSVLTTIKYDAQGNEQWVAHYGSSGTALAIAVDADGNVYVTGGADVGDTAADMIIIKYSSEGERLWLDRYNRVGRSSESGTHLALDAAGNVYVTGRSAAMGQLNDFVTIKYDAQGNRLWLAHYNGEANSDDVPRGLVVGRDGSVWVTGSSRATGGVGLNHDYLTLKYDAQGNQLWEARYDGEAHGSDRPTDIAMDQVGNVYVTGRSEGFSTSDNNYITIKYDPQGNALWLATFTGASPVPGPDFATTSIALDAAGNAYVTGESDGHAVTLKYSAEGAALWVARYGDPNQQNKGRLVEITSAGNVVVGGTSSSAGSPDDILVLNYASVANLTMTVEAIEATESGLAVKVKWDNVGGTDAPRAWLTHASLAGINADGLPQELGDIAAAGFSLVTLQFTGTFPSGDEVILSLGGKFAGGSFSAKRLLQIP